MPTSLVGSPSRTAVAIGLFELALVSSALGGGALGLPARMASAWAALTRTGGREATAAEDAAVRRDNDEGAAAAAAFAHGLLSAKCSSHPRMRRLSSR